MYYRINRELHSWVQDHYRKEDNNDNNKPVTIFDSNSITIPAKPDIVTVPDSSEQQQHIPRKVALLNGRRTKFVINLSKEKISYGFI